MWLVPSGVYGCSRCDCCQALMLLPTISDKWMCQSKWKLILFPPMVLQGLHNCPYSHKHEILWIRVILLHSRAGREGARTYTQTHTHTYTHTHIHAHTHSKVSRNNCLRMHSKGLKIAHLSAVVIPLFSCHWSYQQACLANWQ